jgi:hypothetical protein
MLAGVKEFTLRSKTSQEEAAVLYSAIGVIRLAVVTDIVMFAGAATLTAVVLLRGAKNPALMRTIT